jgi:hypothetical protein
MKRISARVYFLSSAEGFDGKMERGQPSGLHPGGVVCAEIRLFGSGMKNAEHPEQAERDRNFVYFSAYSVISACSAFFL